MNVTEIIKESIQYPISNLNKFFKIGILALIMTIMPLLPVYFSNFAGIQSIGSFISFFISLILLGFLLSVIKVTVEGHDEIPHLESFQNVYDGLKTWVISIVYFVIPTVIVLIVASILGVFDDFIVIFGVIANSGTLTNPGFSYSTSSSAVMSNLTATLPSNLLANIWTGIAITGILAICLFILFSLSYYMALARMAEHGTLFSGAKVNSVMDSLGNIGWEKYIIWYILVFVIMTVLGMVIGLISTVIPYVGLYVAALFITPFSILFLGRSIGLIYKEQ